jgi:hypothetical protein
LITYRFSRLKITIAKPPEKDGTLVFSIYSFIRKNQDMKKGWLYGTSLSCQLRGALVGHRSGTVLAYCDFGNIHFFHICQHLSYYHHMQLF